MSTFRRFTRFSTTARPPRIDQIPDGGFCLSTFVILHPHDRPNHVLMGKINPEAPWEHLGALDKERAEKNSVGWMLPSSHMMLFESPQEAAYRILTEQLSISDQWLSGPYVFSEMYGEKNHWDLEFLFSGEREDVPHNDAWTELTFVDLDLVKKEEIVRLHEDILAHVGKWKTNTPVE